MNDRNKAQKIALSGGLISQVNLNQSKGTE